MTFSDHEKAVEVVRAAESLIRAVFELEAAGVASDILGRTLNLDSEHEYTAQEVLTAAKKAIAMAQRVARPGTY